MLDRGEDAVTDLEGRECSNDVSVAAAFISTSSLTKPSEPSVLCGVIRFLEDPVPRAVSFRLPFSSLRLFVLDCVLCALRAALVDLRGGVACLGLVDGANGGSCGLCIVRARLLGGGWRSDAYRLCVADAVIVGGGIVPLRDIALDDEAPAMALFPCVAGLL